MNNNNNNNDNNNNNFISTKIRLATKSWIVQVYLAIIPRKHVGYELLDSGRGAEHAWVE